ncbi:MAG TPA: CD1871A family CXXC motif-containing protein [Anaerovoracaceae bacterium]|nr:CD1871A family CXXC motif-containing protein [Anaerovoracaceae bacterium]
MQKIRYMLLAVAIIFIGIGIYINEYEVVFAKAIRICLECIGIG